MIHNGIEYGMMQALAEGFALIEARTEFELDVAAIAEMWRHGSVVRSWLLDLTRGVPAATDADARRHRAAASPIRAKGRWTAVGGDRAGSSGAGAVARADDAASRARARATMRDKLLAMMRKGFGGHKITSSALTRRGSADDA